MTLRSKSSLGSRIALWAATLAMVGCGPIEYLSQVSRRAEQTLMRAQREGAAAYAPYEMTAATAYLEEARRKAAHSQYGPALEYGRRADDLANRALAIVREKGAKRGRRGAFDEPPPRAEGAVAPR